MLKYTAKRLLQSVVTIFVVVSAVFLLLRLMPIQSYFDENSWYKISWEVKLTTLQKIGIFDKEGNKLSPFVQLFNFYKTFFTSFSFGESIKIQEGRPALEIVKDKIPYSVGFGVVSTFFQLIIGYVMGVLMAQSKSKGHGAVDLLGTAYIVTIQAIPNTVMFLIMHLYITKWMKWPMLFKADNIKTWYAPVIILILSGMAGTALWLRRYTVDQMNSDYVKLAEAKGLPSTKVMFGHVMRNSFVPMAYNLPTQFILTISGSLILESLCAIPGMGTLLIRAIREHDNNVVQLIVFIYSTMGVIAVLLGDLLVAAIDPRIRLESKGGVR